MAASSGAQTDGSVSSGNSTTLRCAVSGAPKLSVKKSYSLAAVWASSLARCLMGDGEVDLDVARAGGGGADEAAGDRRFRESRALSS